MIFQKPSEHSNTVPTCETLTFREAYNSAFANGVATSESTSIHIARAVTTLTPVASMYRALTLSLEVKIEKGVNNIWELCHEHFPYGFFSHNLFIGFVTPEGPDNYPDVVMDVNLGRSSRSQTSFIIRHLGTPEAMNFIEKLRQHEFKPPIKVTMIRSFGPDGSVNTDDLKFDPKDHWEPHLDFYPFLSENYPGVPKEQLTIDFIVDDFMNSKANLLLLIGPPGTGKSTLNRAFLRPEHEAILVNSAQVLENPALPNTFRCEPRDKEKRMITIYDEAEIFVSPRATGNTQISSLLGHLDGIVASKEKFVVSTNLESISKIDPALLRPGRCHKVFRFRPLEPNEINQARQAIGKPPIEVSTPMTLSEALHHNEVCVEDRKAQPFGFVRKRP